MPRNIGRSEPASGRAWVLGAQIRLVTPPENPGLPRVDDFGWWALSKIEPWTFYCACEVELVSRQYLAEWSHGTGAKFSSMAVVARP